MTVQAESADEKLQSFEVGRVLQSDLSCADNAKHISQSVNTRFIQYITGPDLKNCSNNRSIHHQKQENSFCSLHEYIFRLILYSHLVELNNTSA
jgi:hypothetical protein